MSEHDEGVKIVRMKKVWVVKQNTDRTEGKGGLRNLAICESRETALRLGKGQDVMGSDCNIEEDVAFQVSDNRLTWYVPGSIARPSPEDVKNTELREEKEAILKKASQHLTKEEIDFLMNPKSRT